jgi:hypothetical protein
VEKSRIYIISTDRAFPLAGVLRDKLSTDSSEAIIWREEIEGEVSYTIKEKLENAVKGCDFALIILTRQDINLREGNDEGERQTFDNWLYETGLFFATLGLERCLVISDAEINEFPINLEGIEYLHLNEPAELADPNQLEKIIDPVISGILHSIIKKGKTPKRPKTLLLLPFEKVFERERHKMKGGQLNEGYAMVCDTKPFLSDEKYFNQEWPLQIKENLDLGISYICFFHAKEEYIKNIFSLLKIILLADKEGKLTPVERQNEVMLKNLEDILKYNSLNIYFMKAAPAFRFRLHNASDPQEARAYLRYGETDYFVEWQEGVKVISMWDFFLFFTGPRQQQALFRSNKDFELYEKENEFLSKLKDGISKSFPQIKDKMINLCFRPEENKRKPETI